MSGKFNIGPSIRKTVLAPIRASCAVDFRYQSQNLNGYPEVGDKKSPSVEYFQKAKKYFLARKYPKLTELWPKNEIFCPKTEKIKS